MAISKYPNFTLSYLCAWRGIEKNWSFTSNHSGSVLSTEQALTFLTAVDAVVKAFISPQATDVYLDRYAYYDGVNSAPTIEADFDSLADSQAAGFNGPALYGTAYTEAVNGVCGAESCAVLVAPVGESKTNKPITMRHWIHNVPPSATDGDTLPLAAGANAIAAKLGDGSLPGNRVMCSPSGRQGVWTVNTSFGAHKMSRRWNRTPAEILAGYLHEASQINVQIPALAD